MIVSVEVDVLITQAKKNESRGLYRRALQLWRKVYNHCSLNELQSDLATSRILFCQEQLKANVGNAIVKLGSGSNVEEDKIRIRELLTQGYSIKQIQYITGRSSAFIYKYNPQGKQVL